MKASNTEIISRYKAAYRLAQDCMNAIDSGLPDQTHILNLANAILGADLASGSGNLNKHAGQDSQQESSLQSAFESGSARPVRPTR